MLVLEADMEAVLYIAEAINITLFLDDISLWTKERITKEDRCCIWKKKFILIKHRTRKQLLTF